MFNREIIKLNFIGKLFFNQVPIRIDNFMVLKYMKINLNVTETS